MPRCEASEDFEVDRDYCGVERERGLKKSAFYFYFLMPFFWLIHCNKTCSLEDSSGTCFSVDYLVYFILFVFWSCVQCVVHTYH